MRGEGKSTTTLNLAYSIVEAGKLVLVIEADMRLPTYTKRLNIQTKKGISNLLLASVRARHGLRGRLYGPSVRRHRRGRK